ncbi:hypothetical protein ACF1E8_40055, partial [Streptomyces sp. NPDC014685]
GSVRTPIIAGQQAPLFDSPSTGHSPVGGSRLREHPYLDAYRSALERRAERVRQREEARIAADRARALTQTAQERADRRREAVDARVRATEELYEAAAHAFLEGVVERSSDPAVTEAAMKLSRTWPLLPKPSSPPPPVRRNA